MANTYDFYKPKLESEYPELMDPCLCRLISLLWIQLTPPSVPKLLRRRKTLVGATESESTKTADAKAIFNLHDVDYPVYHSPYGKQVQKGHARLVR